ncbi:MAG: hypothetical protein K0U36_04910 [Alphaproteobacteria bacterium]|nr:hypothetical protein [Alphaproteobacteria bacterium]
MEITVKIAQKGKKHFRRAGHNFSSIETVYEVTEEQATIIRAEKMLRVIEPAASEGGAEDAPKAKKKDTKPGAPKGKEKAAGAATPNDEEKAAGAVTPNDEEKAAGDASPSDEG